MDGEGRVGSCAIYYITRGMNLDRGGKKTGGRCIVRRFRTNENKGAVMTELLINICQW